MKKVTTIQRKRAQLEVLERLFSELEDIEHSTLCRYEKTGTRQETTWRGELLWEDEEQTIPKMESVWEYVPKSENELTDEDCAKQDAINAIKAVLEKMI